MRQFFVRVNGEEFQVEVEEVRGGSKPAPTPRPQVAAPTPVAPAVALAPKVASNGDANVTAPMPGTILAVKVNVGDQVKPGDPVVILEAMKLENHLTAFVSGTVKAVHTSAGASVNPGDLLVEIHSL